MSMTIDRLVRWGLAILVAVASILVIHSAFMQRVELGLYDSRARILAERNPPSEDIVIVAIDEESLQRLEEAKGGELSFPWPRSIYAYVMEYCSAADAIFLDVIMADPDRSPDGKLHDALFVDVAEQMQTLIFSASLTLDESPYLSRQAERIPEELLTDDKVTRPPYANVILPFEGILNSGNRIGHIRYHPDPIDGTLRKYQLVAPLENGKALPSAALATAQAMYDLPKGTSSIGPDREVSVGDKQIQVAPEGHFHILPTSTPHTAYGVADIIASRQQEEAAKRDPEEDLPLIPRDAFAGKVVIFGSLAEGLKDTVITPIDNYTQGMIVHAMALDNLLEGETIRTAGRWVPMAMILLVVFLVALPKNLGSKRTFLLGLALSALLLLAGYGILFLTPYMLPLAAPLLATWLGTLLIGGHTWYIDERERRRQEELEVAKQNFTDMLVHDIKNAVAPMSLAVEFIQDAAIQESPELLEEFISTAGEAQSNLMYLVGNLLDIRKLEEGKLPINMEPLMPSEYIPGITQMFQSTAQRKGKPIFTNVKGESALNADPNILKRVLENLLWNAIAYGEAKEPILLDATDEGGHWCIRLANDCKTISEENLARLFDAYVSGTEQGNNMPMRSTGLGLAFCKMAILGHGGTIDARSPRPGKEQGIEFTICLPNKLNN